MILRSTTFHPTGKVDLLLTDLMPQLTSIANAKGIEIGTMINKTSDDLENGATSEEMPEYSNFFQQVAICQSSMAIIKTNTISISKNAEALSIITDSETEKTTISTNEELVSETNSQVRNVTNVLETFKSDNEELLEKSPHKTAEYRVKTNMTNNLSRKLKYLVLDYQNVQGKYSQIMASRAKSNLMFICPDISDNEANQILETDSGSGLSQELLKTKLLGKTTHSEVLRSLNKMKDKYTDIKKLESSVIDLHQMFTELAILVDHQGEVINSIEYSVVNTKNYTHQAEKQLISARKYQRKAQKTMVMIIVCCVIIILVITIPIVINSSISNAR